MKYTFNHARGSYPRELDDEKYLTLFHRNKHSNQKIIYFSLFDIRIMLFRAKVNRRYSEVKVVNYYETI